MLLGGDNFWALEETPKAVVEEAADADEETTKDVAEGMSAAAVKAKYAAGEVIIFDLFCCVSEKIVLLTFMH